MCTCPSWFWAQAHDGPLLKHGFSSSSLFLWLVASFLNLSSLLPASVRRKDVQGAFWPTLWSRFKMYPQRPPEFSILLLNFQFSFWQVFRIYPYWELLWGEGFWGLTAITILTLVIKAQSDYMKCVHLKDELSKRRYQRFSERGLPHFFVSLKLTLPSVLKWNISMPMRSS